MQPLRIDAKLDFAVSARPTQGGPATTERIPEEGMVGCEKSRAYAEILPA
jgi:hypothetical protein